MPKPSWSGSRIGWATTTRKSSKRREAIAIPMARSRGGGIHGGEAAVDAPISSGEGMG